MKNILIPTDFSENSWNAIVYALNFFEGTPCNFYFLHVNTINTLVGVETTYIPTQSVINEAFVKPSKKQLTELLESYQYVIIKNRASLFYAYQIATILLIPLESMFQKIKLT